MKWFHEVNPEWLAARRAFITASDMVKLLPTTPTGRARNVEPVQRAIWAGKQCMTSESDIQSTGAMARGHILEPYAIDALNRSGLCPVEIFHWDDTLIHTTNGVACSPDGLDAPQPDDCPVVLASADCITHCEVKCYGGKDHYEKGAMLSNNELDERWQIATAFYVMPTLEHSYLVFFNPSANHPLFVRYYSRADLADELAMIDKIREDYYDAVPGFHSIAQTLCGPGISSVCPLEETIVTELEEKAAAEAGCLNP